MMLTVWLRRIGGTAITLVAAGLLFATPAHAGDAYVTVKDNAYEAARVEVTVGDRVVWRWSDSNRNRHTVTALDGSFDSHPDCGGALDGCGDRQRPGFAVTFDEPGTYRYVCKVHSVTMTGSVVVSAPSDEGSERESEPAVPGDLLEEPSESESSPPADDTDDTQGSDADEGDEPSRQAERSRSTQDDGASDGESRRSVRSASAARVVSARDTSATSSRANFPSLDIVSRQIPVAESGPETALAPEVAAPEVAPPSEPAQPQEPTSELDDLAVEIPMGGSRDLPAPVVGIGIATLAAAGAGLTKFVLLKRPVG